jgi:hypothetical protein
MSLPFIMRSTGVPPFVKPLLAAVEAIVARCVVVEVE